MTTDDAVIWLLLFACAMFILSAAVLIYACAQVLAVNRKLKKMCRAPEVARWSNGRPLKERL